MSATGEFLATAHADGVGVNLWSNMGLFAPISTRHVDEGSIADARSPIVSGERGAEPVEAAFVESFQEPDALGPALSSGQLDRDMVTLSTVPRSKWQTLLHLGVIRVSPMLLLYILYSCSPFALGIQQVKAAGQSPSEGSLLSSDTLW